MTEDKPKKPTPIRPPAKTRTMARLSITPEMAYVNYLAMGSNRSIPNLAAMLANEGIMVSEGSIAAWAAKGRWGEQSKAFDAKAQKLMVDELLTNTVAMNTRQARVARTLQRLVEESIDALLRPGEDGTPGLVLTIDQIPRILEVATRIERLAAGAATSRTEGSVTYNTIIVPVLALFQQVMGELPAELRDKIVREFADGVNAIRDSVVQPEFVAERVDE